MGNLKSLLRPESIAVIGASAEPGKLGHVLFRNVLEYGFQGPVFPVNPKGGEILGTRCFPSVREIPDDVDLALVSIPERFVLDTVRECAGTGVKALVILSSGFGEAGEEGRKIQNEISAICRETGMRVMGPNCMGIYNIQAKVNGTYFWELPREEGNVSFISQSGAYGGILFNEIRHRQIGISIFASIGNTADITHADLIEALTSDPRTGVIALFIEGIRDGRAFLQAAERAARVKPVIAFKAGRSPAGQRAALSHTGSMAGSYRVYETAFRECGIFLEKDTDRFFDVITALATQQHYPPAAEGMAVLTISGGPCVAASDRAEEIGISIPTIDDETREKVRELIPSFGADQNPVDMTPQMNPDNYERCVDLVLGADGIGGAIAINVGLDVPQFGDAVVKAHRKHKKPLVSFTFDTPEITRRFKEACIPILPTPERSVDAYNALLKFHEHLIARAGKKDPGGKYSTTRPKKDLSTSLIESLEKGQTVLDSRSGIRLLAEYGIPTVPQELAFSVDEAIDWAERSGYPVVLKVASPGILHKADREGLILGIPDRAHLEPAWVELKGRFADHDSFLIQKMVAGEIEVLIGAKDDPSFGPVVTIGFGGIYTEVVRDFSLSLCPLDRDEAMEMIRRLKSYEILAGYRRKQPYNLNLLGDIAAGVSRLVWENPSVREVDVNPVILLGQQAVAVDNLIVLQSA